MILAETAWNGPTTISLIVGSAGLLLAMLSFGWQVRQWRRSRLTVVRVSMVRFSMLGRPGMKPDAEALVLKAINESDFKIRVESVGLEYTDDIVGVDYEDDTRSGEKKGTFFWPPPDGGTLPGVIEPMDAGYTSRGFRDGDIEYFPPSTRLRAYVTTVNQLRFETPWVDVSEIPLSFEMNHAVPLPRELRADPANA